MISFNHATAGFGGLNYELLRGCDFDSLHKFRKNYLYIIELVLVHFFMTSIRSVVILLSGHLYVNKFLFDA
jgi:hypothetical protein